VAFFNSQKTQLEADAKATLDALGTTIETDAQTAVQNLTNTFVANAKAEFVTLQNNIINDTTASFNTLIGNIQSSALSAVQNLQTTVSTNTQNALSTLITSITTTVTTTVSNFINSVIDGIVGQLGNVTLDNVDVIAAQIANMSATNLQSTFTNLITQIQTMSSNAVTSLIQQNSQATSDALTQLGNTVLSQAQSAASTLAGTIQQDVVNAFQDLLTQEENATLAALQTFVSKVQTDTINNLVSAAQQEFTKVQDLISKTATVPTFTATMNGISVGAANINQLMNSLSGFGSEDFPGAALLTGASTGLGGPNARIWAWYAGTIQTALLNFQGTTIDRRLSDTGLRATVYGFPLTGQEYTATGWYFVNPVTLTNTANAQQQYVAASAGIPLGSVTNLIEEGVGAGFFFAPDGGGLAYDPVNAKTTATTKIDPATTVNTTATIDGSTVPAVETVFNGNFQQGISQSLFTHLYDPTAPWGRFPVSYQLPGWSFQGGGGFTLSANVNLPVLGQVSGTIDVTGLFVLPTDAYDQLKPMIDSYITSAVDSVVSYLEAFYLNKAGGFTIPPIPDATLSPQANAAWQQFYGVAGTYTTQLDQANQVINEIQAYLTQVAGANPLGLISVGGTQLSDIFAVNGTQFLNTTAIDNFKTFLIDNADKILQSLLPTASEGLLFGGASALLTVLQTAFNLSTGNDPAFQPFVADILQAVASTANFSTLTHDRLFVPTTDNYLNFNIYVPLALTPSTTLEVTLALDNGGTLVANFVQNGSGSGTFYPGTSSGGAPPSSTSACWSKGH